MTSTNNQKDKRQSVRIDSRLLFGHRKIPAQEFELIRRDCSDGISLYNRKELANIQVYIGAKAALSKLQDRDRDLALFLQHLDGKLNLLLKKLDSSPSVLDDLVLQSINLSGDGLAFWTEIPYLPNDLVEMHIVMPDDSNYINCFGSVVEATAKNGADGNTLYRVSTKYLLIMESDKETLIQHNFKQQSLALQRRRLDQENK